jgi:hypothetical protein
MGYRVALGQEPPDTPSEPPVCFRSWAGVYGRARVRDSWFNSQVRRVRLEETETWQFQFRYSLVLSSMCTCSGPAVYQLYLLCHSQLGSRGIRRSNNFSRNQTRIVTWRGK